MSTPKAEERTTVSVFSFSLVRPASPLEEDIGACAFADGAALFKSTMHETAALRTVVR